MLLPAKGAKWTATKWYHPKQYMGRYDSLNAATVCRDLSANCAVRAKAGDCERPELGLVGQGGTCRKTCEDCRDCNKGDRECMRLNFEGLRSLGLSAVDGMSHRRS